MGLRPVTANAWAFLVARLTEGLVQGHGDEQEGNWPTLDAR